MSHVSKPHTSLFSLLVTLSFQHWMGHWKFLHFCFIFALKGSEVLIIWDVIPLALMPQKANRWNPSSDVFPPMLYLSCGYGEDLKCECLGSFQPPESNTSLVNIGLVTGIKDA